jgi:hypothetical protein
VYRVDDIHHSAGAHKQVNSTDTLKKAAPGTAVLGRAAPAGWLRWPGGDLKNSVKTCYLMPSAQETQHAGPGICDNIVMPRMMIYKSA